MILLGDMKNKKSKFLVIAPHHDDEIIGCGGTILKLLDMGMEGYVVHVFDGSSGVAGFHSSQESRKIRSTEAKKASKIGRYVLLNNLGHKDRTDDNITSVINSLIKVVRRIRPDYIFSPHSEESDFEHYIVSRASWEASWLATTRIFPKLGTPSHPIKAFLGYEVWTPIQNVSCSIDITEYISKKRQMLEVFKSQMQTTSWIKGSIGLSEYRGATLQGYGHAEAFTIKKLPGTVTEKIFK